MTRFVVTGGSGKAGRAVVRDLFEHGHVLNGDRVPSAESSGPDSPAPFLPADLTDFCQTLEALTGGERLPGVDAVVHLAAIPSPVHATSDVVFRANITSTHTVFAAAVRLGLDRVVWASSETTLGLPFDRPLDYAPIDERHELRPESSYALSKVLGEEMARQFSRWSGIPFVGLRFSNIMERADHERFPSFWDDPRLRKWNLWSHVDASHVAQSVRRALEADVRGAEALIIAAADTVMRTLSRQLMARVFPGVPVKADLWPNTAACSVSTRRADCWGTRPTSPGGSWTYDAGRRRRGESCRVARRRGANRCGSPRVGWRGQHQRPVRPRRDGHDPGGCRFISTETCGGPRLRRLIDADALSGSSRSRAWLD